MHIPPLQTKATAACLPESWAEDHAFNAVLMSLCADIYWFNSLCPDKLPFMEAVA